MIKFNNSDIIDWNFDDSNIIKVYHNGAIVFYKFDSEQGGYKVCYAVVDDITQYTDREFEDVFDKATEKWYKLNNLNQYEQYGVYGSGRNVTTYDGKLTIDGDYEYQYSGSSWVNVGEVSGSSEESWVAATELIESTSYSDNTYTITKWKDNVSVFHGMKLDKGDGGWGAYCWADFKSPDYSSGSILSIPSSNETHFIYHGITYRPNGGGAMPSCFTLNNGWYIFDFDKMSSDDGYSGTYLYSYQERFEIENMYFLTSVYAPEYPVYYDEKTEPLDNLTFDTLAEAQAYAEANCVYDGMHATIGTDRYYFDSSDENGWVKILEYYKFEDVTPGGASGWTISGSSTYNPDSSYYDDFDLETTSTSNVTKIAKVTIYGYDHFTYYLRTTGRTIYCYVAATNVDEVSTPPSSLSYNSSSAITNTYYWNKSPKSAVNLSNYRRVTYNNLDKTVEHTFYVYFYGRTYSSYVGNATILIPKEQTNENWEQVTFSASSNVASVTKNLYIDGNNSTSGGTSYFCYRWIVGLPSGSHSSYTNYSNYNYCPNATSSTFTSVAGEQRQVNFTYDNATNKNLSFRLTDGSNVLTPSNTVYFNMTYYNSCGASSSTNNVTFPRSQSVKVGGRFRFANSSNRHYIYGYSPNISLNTNYYVDNYQSTFDITYTKLSEEAVTVTYTTYDPSDTEVPAFKTDITWPYSGGTTSSTTLASYAVPYTYSYKVSQTNNKFSADSQTYTAGQSSRTINFVLYPNNREFATVADMEAYAYAWEGMIAYVGADRYVYQNGEWVYNPSKDSDFVIGDFNTFVSSSTEVTEGYYIIYYYGYNSSYADKNYLLSWNSGNTWSGYYTLGNMNHRDTSASVPISSSEIIDDAVWEFKDAGNGYFYIRNVGANKYWYYLGTNTSYGVPLTDNANNATPVSIQDWRSCLAFAEKQSGSNHPINRLYNYPYRYGWYSSLSTDGNNQYYMRKYVP